MNGSHTSASSLVSNLRWLRLLCELQLEIVLWLVDLDIYGFTNVRNPYAFSKWYVGGLDVIRLKAVPVHVTVRTFITSLPLAVFNVVLTLLCNYPRPI